MAHEEGTEAVLGVFENRPGAAIVTGGSGGVGAQVCRLLACRGADVAFSYHSRPEAAGETVASVEAQGAEALALQADLTDADSARALGEAAIERFGGVHTVVHAAGPHVNQIYLSTVEPARYQRHLEQEAGAFFNLVQPLLEPLREQQGAIVAVTSVAIRRYPTRDSLSSSPKAAVEALVRAIAVEEGRFGIRANCVAPGILGEGMTERLIATGEMDERAIAAAQANIPLRRFGAAADVAEAVCFLASPQASYITAQTIDVDGGYAA